MQKAEPYVGPGALPPTPTYRLLIEYDGTEFCGWQAQPELPTIQTEIERALSVALRHPVSVVGSGRTDAGVHARGQVAHFRTGSRFNHIRLRGSLNGLLPRSIKVVSLEPAAVDFHARYDATRRRYHYYVSTIPIAVERESRVQVSGVLDFGRMNRAAEALLGRHDFGTFCRTASATKNRVCTVFAAKWIEESRHGYWHFRIEADRFLHGMVRAVVGTLIEVGRARRSADEFERLLPQRDRRAAGPAAPARGLVLEAVTYDPAQTETKSLAHERP